MAFIHVIGTRNISVSNTFIQTSREKRRLLLMGTPTDSEINVCIDTMQMPVWHLEDSACANVWERNGIKLDTKLKVYKAVVLSTLLYACETWTVYKNHSKRLRLNLKLFEKAVKNQVKRQCSRHRGPEESRDAKHAYSMHIVLKLAQLRWAGRAIRMPDERLLKKVSMETYRRLTGGKAHSMWPEEMLQRHYQKDFKGL